MNKKFLFICIALLIVILGFVFFMRNRGEATGELAMLLTSSQQLPASTSSLLITVTQIEGWNPSTGWFTIEEKEQTIDVAALIAGEASVKLAEVELPVQEFNRIRLHLDRVFTKTAKEEEVLTTLSDFITLDTTVVIEEERTTGIELDLRVADSLYQTASGVFIFIPNQSMKQFSNATLITEENTAYITGDESLEIQYGMDETGSMRVNYSLPRTSRIEERGGGVLITHPSSSMQPAAEQPTKSPPLNSTATPPTSRQPMLE